MLSFHYQLTEYIYFSNKTNNKRIVLAVCVKDPGKIVENCRLFMSEVWIMYEHCFRLNKYTANERSKSCCSLVVHFREQIFTASRL